MRSIIALPFVTFFVGIVADPILVDREPTVVERDVPTITNILLAVGSGISTLDLAVQAFTSDSTAIDSDSSTLLASIESGTVTVAGSGNLTLNNAISLAAPVTALQALGESLVNDLIAMKSAFEASESCPMPTLATMERESTFIWRMPKSAMYIQPAGMPVTLHRPTDGNCAAMPGCVMVSVKRPRTCVEMIPAY